MNYKDEIIEQRTYKVDKSNKLIQKARYEMSLMELKTLTFLISKIRPTDKPGATYQFKISDYCNVRGIDDKTGKNRKLLMESLQSIADKSFWLEDEKGDIVLCRWLTSPKILDGTKKGWIQIRFDSSIEKYLMELKAEGNYTQYQLLYTLPMNSVYSVRLYELLKSIHGREIYHMTNHFEEVKKDIEIEELRIRVGSSEINKNGQIVSEKYPKFKEFKRNVLDVAIKEINNYTDLNVDYTKLTRGRKVEGIMFTIKYKDTIELNESEDAIEAALNAREVPGQMSILDLNK